MTKKNEEDKFHSRLPVSLTVEDNRILMELQYKMQQKKGQRLSYSDVMRECIRTQAELEGIKCK